jgi:hypothetical protein
MANIFGFFRSFASRRMPTFHGFAFLSDIGIAMVGLSFKKKMIKIQSNEMSKYEQVLIENDE